MAFSVRLTFVFVAARLINNFQAPVVQKLDSAIHRINHYSVESAIGFAITYPLDSDLSGG